MEEEQDEEKKEKYKKMQKEGDTINLKFLNNQVTETNFNAIDNEKRQQKKQEK